MTATEHLIKHGIRPSVQRIAVMNYLLEHRTHPTVDEMYVALSKDMPTLSKTTVYNTLELLVKQKAVLELTIDSKMSHYDGYTHAHAHFKCKRCGKIFDLPISDAALNALQIHNGFLKEDLQVYYCGVCPQCVNNENN